MAARTTLMTWILLGPIASSDTSNSVLAQGGFGGAAPPPPAGRGHGDGRGFEAVGSFRYFVS